MSERIGVFAQAIEALRAAADAPGARQRALPNRQDAAAVVDRAAAVLFPEYGSGSTSGRHDGAAELRALAEHLRALVTAELHVECARPGDGATCPDCAPQAKRVVVESRVSSRETPSATVSGWPSS